jgi:hypothetical protein
LVSWSMSAPVSGRGVASTDVAAAASSGLDAMLVDSKVTHVAALT